MTAAGRTRNRGLRRQGSSVAKPMAVSDGPRPAGAMPAGRQSPREIWVYWALATGVLVLALQLVWFVGYR